MTDDRAARESIADFLSVGGSGGAGETVDGSGGRAVAAGNKPARNRDLLPTFRAVPGGPAFQPGGTLLSPNPSALSPHSSDRGTPGGNLSPARGGADLSPAPAPGSDNPARRGAAVLAAGPDPAAANGAAIAAATGGEGRRVRGRIGRAAGSGKKGKQAKASAAKPALPREIAKLVSKDASPAPPRVLVPTESERADARRLFREIGERFNENRKKSKTAAYSGYRHDLMANLDTLVMGGALDLKDATTIITNLEQFTKETEAESTETPATILGRWLRMAPGEVAELEQGTVETEGEVEEEIEESDDEPGDQLLEQASI